MNLRELQHKTHIWRLKNFPPEHRDAVHQALGVAEESGELAHAVLKLSQGIRGSKDEHLEEAADAVGDLVIFLAGVCTELGLDLQGCVEQTWRQVEQRDWKANPETG